MEVLALPLNSYLPGKERAYETRNAYAMVIHIGLPIDSEHSICGRCARDDFGRILRGLF
jgi:hypothetical protein